MVADCLCKNISHLLEENLKLTRLSESVLCWLSTVPGSWEGAEDVFDLPVLTLQKMVEDMRSWLQKIPTELETEKEGENGGGKKRKKTKLLLGPEDPGESEMIPEQEPDLINLEDDIDRTAALEDDIYSTADLEDDIYPTADLEDYIYPTVDLKDVIDHTRDLEGDIDITEDLEDEKALEGVRIPKMYTKEGGQKEKPKRTKKLLNKELGSTKTGSVDKVCNEIKSKKRGKYQPKESVIKNGRYPCEVCEKTFSRNSHRKHHTKTQHFGIRYPCDQCEYSSSNAYNLNTHKEVKHSGVRFVCDQCEVICSSKNALAKHKKIKHLGASL